MPDAERLAVDFYPLTYMQRRLLDKRSIGSTGSSKVWLSFQLDGELDVGALMAAIDAMVVRHDALRLRLGRDDNGTVVQYALSSEDDQPAITLEEVACESAESFADYVQEQLLTQIHLPYDLKSEPPARFFLFRFSPVHHAFLAVFSPFIMDGRSRAMFSGELWKLYASMEGRDAVPYPPAAPSFLEAARRLVSLHEKRATTSNAEYWRQRLTPSPAFTPLAELQAHAVQEGRGTVRNVVLREQAMNEIADAATRSRCSHFEIIFSRTASVLATVLGLDRLAILVTNDFRTAADREVLGSFAGSLPIILDREQGAAEPVSLRQVQHAVLRARVHGCVAPSAMTDCYDQVERVTGAKIRDAMSFVYLDHTVSSATPEQVGDLRIKQGVGVPEHLLATPLLDVLANVGGSQTRLTLVLNHGAFPAGTVDRVVAGLATELGGESAAIR